jgi:hypothetical protein
MDRARSGRGRRTAVLTRQSLAPEVPRKSCTPYAILGMSHAERAEPQRRPAGSEPGSRAETRREQGCEGSDHHSRAAPANENARLGPVLVPAGSARAYDPSYETLDRGARRAQHDTAPIAKD